jgi:hypothetical protein
MDSWPSNDGELNGITVFPASDYTLIDAHGAGSISTIHAGLSRIALEPALHRGWGKVLQQGGLFGNGERIVLPLASDHQNADEVFGATEYRFPNMDTASPTVSISEHEEWFRLT